MPARQGNVGGGLLAKLGDRLRQAHEAHKGDETEFSNFGDLPPGIEGVAELEDCEFQKVKEGKDNAGEYQFYASGIVLEPINFTYEDPPKSGRFKTVKVEGKRTFIVEALYDTLNSKGKRKTLDDHLKWIYNELRKLGYDTSNMELEDLEPAVAALRDQKPRFKFRTWKGEPSADFPNPRVNHQWEGLVDEDYVPPDASQDNDQTGVSPSAAPPTRNGTVHTSPTQTSTQTPSDMSDLEFGDLDSLLKMAKGKDGVPQVEAAQKQLATMAAAVGYDQDAVDAAGSWEEVVEWIKQGNAAAEGEAEAETEPEAEAEAEVEASDQEAEPETESEPEPPPVPKKGETWKARLADPKNPKKKLTKLAQVEIIMVNVQKKTANVKNLADRKVHNGISFEDLVPAD